jgi:hypothetical protein
MAHAGSIDATGTWATTGTIDGCGTETGTFIISYASGKFTGSYSSPNGLEANCTYSGPYQTSRWAWASSYGSSSQYLTEAQFRQGLSDFWGVPFSTTSFPASNRVLSTGSQSGTSFSYEMTRTSGGTPQPFALSATISGMGIVASNPAGISCGSDCSESYTSGTKVTLTATPGSGSTFSGWSGACSGTATTCTVTMDAAKTVKVGFVAQNPSDCIFDWAERDFPQYFAPAKASSAYYQNYYYRYYATTGVYLATNDNILWALGPPTGNALLSLGPMSNFLQAAGCR